MLNDAEILKLFLPELLIEHFEVVKFGIVKLKYIL